MALFPKQDFSPPILSRKWIAIKFRPNMLINSRENIVVIMESGLLFREDCMEVQQNAPSAAAVWRAAGGSRNGWLTRGERLGAGVLVAACLIACPPRNARVLTLVRTAAIALAPLPLLSAHRRRCRGSLHVMLVMMLEYSTLARRAAACCREFSTLHALLGSLTSVIESTRTMLCRQQSELSVLMSRASSAILGNMPWLRDDIAWDAMERDDSASLFKIHHAFLVIQSTLLKHIAMAHFVLPAHTQKVYKNHNERIYWLHSVVLTHLTEEFRNNYGALIRMYRLLKNYGAKDMEPKKPGTVINDSWLYTDVHTDIARTNLELKLTLTKCNSIDIFLDTCALNNQMMDVELLNSDIENLIDNITKCLSTAQSSQIRLKKLHRKLESGDTKAINNDETTKKEDSRILKIEDKDPEIKDEVFYFMKIEDDTVSQAAADLITEPGKKEKETTKLVLNELKKKLIKREDMMRERERQALAKTMPELQTIPEFPRQISLMEFADRKGFISKIKKDMSKTKPFSRRCHGLKALAAIKNYRVQEAYYTNEDSIEGYICETSDKFNFKESIITAFKEGDTLIITKWCKNETLVNNTDDSDDIIDQDLMEALNKKEDNSTKNEIADAIKAINNEENTVDKNAKFNNHLPEGIKFSRKDREISSDSDSDCNGREILNEMRAYSTSESDSEFNKMERAEILKDLRRYRENRKTNIKSEEEEIDESMRPVEFNLGASLAMASVLQINRDVKRPVLQEEVFVGSGEVSSDSGNDD